MIALAQERFSQRDWRVGDMRQLSLGVEFDGVLAWDSFFDLSPDDQRGMFPVSRRHAAPGAALMFTSGPSRGERSAAFGSEPLYHSSLDPAEYRDLLAANGFRGGRAPGAGSGLRPPHDLTRAEVLGRRFLSRR